MLSSIRFETDLAVRAVKAGLQIQPGMHLLPHGICVQQLSSCVVVFDPVTNEVTFRENPLPDMLHPGVQGMAIDQLEDRLKCPGQINVNRSHNQDPTWYGTMRYKNTVVKGETRAEALVKLMEAACQ